MVRHALIVVDEPVETDRRVRAMIRDIEERGYSASIVDARDRMPANLAAKSIAAFRTWRDSIVIYFEMLKRIGRLRKLWRSERIGEYRYPWFTHYTHEAMSMLGAIYRGHLMRQSMARQPDLVVANDLLAGAYARALLGARAAERLYYDAHEFSPFRNRENNSTARIVVDFAVEAWVASRSWRMGCVSQGICARSADLYAPVKIDYVPNAYYEESHKPDEKIDPEKPLHIVYFGAPSLGRGLQILGEAAAGARNHLRVTMFVPDFLPFHPALEWVRSLENVTVHFGYDYEDKLLELMKTDATFLSWCVIEDLCLSYRMAEPSKFHQSRMFGIPVLCAEGQQLEDIVRADGNGIVLSRAELAAPATMGAKLREHLRAHAHEIGPATVRSWENSLRFPGWNWPIPSDK